MDKPRPKLVKRTYEFPDDLIARFEALVPPEKRDEVMNQVIKKWLEQQRLAEHQAHIEGDSEEWPELAIVWPNGLKAEREKHGDNFNSEFLS